mmetsp:Transcript_1427/g.3434  ORF Transcript_1427/g.3434 Transcript_1427/m.3434 type:complete len:237 (+) Transcript_1427:159-869(+)
MSQTLHLALCRRVSERGPSRWYSTGALDIESDPLLSRTVHVNAHAHLLRPVVPVLLQTLLTDKNSLALSAHVQTCCGSLRVRAGDTPFHLVHEDAHSVTLLCLDRLLPVCRKVVPETPSVYPTGDAIVHPGFRVPPRKLFGSFGGVVHPKEHLAQRPPLLLYSELQVRLAGARQLLSNLRKAPPPPRRRAPPARLRHKSPLSEGYQVLPHALDRLWGLEAEEPVPPPDARLDGEPL